MQFVNTKPREKIFEALPIPVPLPDPTTSPASMGAYRAERITYKENTIQLGGADCSAAIFVGVGSISAVILSVLFALFKLLFIKNKQNKKPIKSPKTERHVKQEELTLADILLANEGKRHDEQLFFKIEILDKELTILNKKINKLEDELAKVKTKK